MKKTQLISLLILTLLTFFSFTACNKNSRKKENKNCNCTSSYRTETLRFLPQTGTNSMHFQLLHATDLVLSYATNLESFKSQLIENELYEVQYCLTDCEKCKKMPVLHDCGDGTGRFCFPTPIQQCITIKSVKKFESNCSELTMKITNDAIREETLITEITDIDTKSLTVNCNITDRVNSTPQNWFYYYTQAEKTEDGVLIFKAKINSNNFTKPTDKIFSTCFNYKKLAEQVQQMANPLKCKLRILLNNGTHRDVDLN